MRVDPRMVALVAVALALAAGCADKSPSTTAEPVTFGSSSPSASGTASAPPTGPPVDPRTILPLAGTVGKDPATRARPAVATVLRFAPGGAPVLGLDAADLVYQQPGKGSGSRLVALYHSADAGRVGPIGGTQPADVLLLSVIKPIYVHGGGADRLTSKLTGSGLSQVGPDRAGAGFSTVAGGLYGATATLRKAAPAGARTPAQPLVYGEPGQPISEAQTASVRSVRVSVPGQPPQVWTRDATGGWVQSGAGAPRLRVANLVIVETRYRDLRSDKAGTLVAEPSVLGKGRVTAVSGNRLVKGAWARPTRTSVANYADAEGVPLRLAPGRTWVLMAPPGTTVSWR